MSVLLSAWVQNQRKISNRFADSKYYRQIASSYLFHIYGTYPNPAGPWVHTLTLRGP